MVRVFLRADKLEVSQKWKIAISQCLEKKDLIKLEKVLRLGQTQHNLKKRSI